MGDAIDQPTQAPKKKKKALAFLKPTSKPEPTLDEDFDFIKDAAAKPKEKEDDEDPLDMFRRSKDFFPQIKKEKSSAQEATPEPKPDSLKRTTEDSDDEAPIPSSGRSSKRRKVSSEWMRETYDELYGPPSPARHSSRPLNQSSPAWVPLIEQASPSKGKSKSKGTELVHEDSLPTPSTRSNSHQLPVDAEEPDDDEDFPKEDMSRDRRTQSPRRSVSKRSASPVLLEDSDDEILDTGPELKDDPLAHFVAAARKRQEDAARAAAAAANSESSDDDGSNDNAEQRARRKKAAPFIAVKILVKSCISTFENPEGQLLALKRKSTQSLGPVKTAFVQWLGKKQGAPVSEEMSDDIFLTWKGRRIYTSVSVVGLGVVVLPNGKIDAPDGPGFELGGILLEAWTTEDFERHEAEEEQKRLISRGEIEEEGLGDEEEDEEPEPQVAKIRIYLQEKGKEPVGMTAYVDTALKVIIGAYVRQNNLPTGQEFRLSFDGEWLDQAMTLEQAGIEELCTVEVYPK